MPMVQFLLGDKTWPIETSGQQSLLELALSIAIPVNYSCKRGDCGQCVGRLLAGHISPVDAAFPLRCDNGLYLCNARACDDLIVELPHVPELENIRVMRSPCKIHELIRVSGDVLQLSIRLPPAARFEFLPGQYIRLTNKHRVTRSYSLADAPGSDKLLRIHVRRIASGAFSRYLFESANSGDLLHLEGPMGQFILRSSIAVRKTVFLATGTGIAPIHAILSSLDVEQIQRCGDLFLYWGNRREEDAYLSKSLENLARRLKLNYFPLFSRSPCTGRQPGARYVQDLMAAHHTNLADAQVFASGNAAMVAEGQGRASSLGLPAARFFRDAFTAS